MRTRTHDHVKYIGIDTNGASKIQAVPKKVTKLISIITNLGQPNGQKSLAIIGNYQNKIH